VDREEWWWVMDDSVDHIAGSLEKNHFVFMDNFLLEPQAMAVANEVKQCHKEGRLRPGILINGKKKSDGAEYLQQAVRGDECGWFDCTSDKDWPYGRAVDSHLTKLGTLVSELAETGRLPDLNRITGRSLIMATCYPGSGARYVAHVDNDMKHPLARQRVLTAIIYLTEDWTPAVGGELAVFAPHSGKPGTTGDFGEPIAICPPKLGRVVLFFSDWRVPHEVLPAWDSRYAVTLWLLDTSKAADPVPRELEAAIPSQQPKQEVDQVKHKWEGDQLLVTVAAELGPPEAVMSPFALDMTWPSLRWSLPTPYEVNVDETSMKWSKKRGELRVSMVRATETTTVVERQVAELRAQLDQSGEGVVDGMLPGIAADKARTKALGAVSSDGKSMAKFAAVVDSFFAVLGLERATGALVVRDESEIRCGPQDVAVAVGLDPRGQLRFGAAKVVRGGVLEVVGLAMVLRYK